MQGCEIVVNPLTSALEATATRRYRFVDFILSDKRRMRQLLRGLGNSVIPGNEQRSEPGLKLVDLVVVEVKQGMIVHVCGNECVQIVFNLKRLVCIPERLGQPCLFVRIAAAHVGPDRGKVIVRAILAAVIVEKQQCQGNLVAFVTMGLYSLHVGCKLSVPV